jgi:putative NADH-flavin reductase
MRLAVIGAAGATGRLIVKHALKNGHDVTAVVRDPTKMGDVPGVRAVQADMMDVASLEAALRGHDAVVFAAGPPHMKASTARTDGARNTVAAMKSVGIRRLVAISGLGAGETRDKLGFIASRIVVPLILGRLLMDQNGLEQAIRASDLDWTIVRPGELKDGASKGGVKVSQDGTGISSSVSRDDVAKFIVDELTASKHIRNAPALGH